MLSCSLGSEYSWLQQQTCNGSSARQWNQNWFRHGVSWRHVSGILCSPITDFLDRRNRRLRTSWKELQSTTSQYSFKPTKLISHELLSIFQSNVSPAVTLCRQLLIHLGKQDVAGIMNLYTRFPQCQSMRPFSGLSWHATWLRSCAIHQKKEHYGISVFT